ncbi:toll/interleukin-1 receptor domain-containing protein [Lysinibacillus sp. FSL R7-0073]|uniref:toll/interleukin-1 receptor domain-containing protein n=1 Tax=Lysinibacillus sp. FSL R7-0073 TaxID=2921669 RepID=UPI0030FD06B7
MNIKQINKLCRDFRANSSRLLSTKLGSEQQDLSRFLLFIENNTLIKEYVSECIQDTLDFEDILSSKDWNDKLELPLNPKEEVSYIYQLLKYIELKNAYIQVSIGYGSGNKIQDQIDAFNHQVTVHLVNHIREYLEDVITGIESVPLQIIEEDQPKIFISYCWEDKMFADLIDEDFKVMGYTLTRDIRGLKFKDSIKSFMESIGKHDFVISIISDKYLKSVNCMYEISEVMRLREYKEKMLLVILRDSDVELLPKGSDMPVQFAANIYSIEEQINYITYWENKETEYLNMISKITQEISKIQPLQELKRVKSISGNMSEFLSDISDWNNTNLFELKESNYEAFIKEIKTKVN